VENSPLTRTVTAALIRQLGYRVLEAESGSAALGHFTARPIGAVLLDIDLEDTDGYVVAGQLRRHDASVPIIGCSAHPPRGRGFDAFLPKPFGKSDLRETLAAWLPPEGPQRGRETRG
jgi:CheY-like chemotaxis protein